MAGKQTLYQTMLQRYCCGQRGVPRQITEAIRAGDTATAERLAHTLKGVSGSVGAVEVQSLADAVEQGFRNEVAADELRQRIAALDEGLAQLLAQLDSCMPEAAPSGPAAAVC
jgi:HPt (histidine-containing phosphotransfer) domain-containing protein